MPLKARMIVLWSLNGSHAKPSRGANCFSWFGIREGSSLMPEGNVTPFTSGTIALFATGVGFNAPSQRRP